MVYGGDVAIVGDSSSRLRAAVAEPSTTIKTAYGLSAHAAGVYGDEPFVALARRARSASLFSGRTGASAAFSMTGGGDMLRKNAGVIARGDASSAAIVATGGSGRWL